MDFLYPAGRFSLSSTLECGQSFRWKKNTDGSYSGVAGCRALRIRQEAGLLCFYDTTKQEFETFWKNYFDLETDYDAIYRCLCRDETVKKAYDYTGEIHILRQNGWEGLCSFILSQNNNIPRIMGIIERLCEAFGQRLDRGGYGFPSAERLAACSLENLSVLRAGFRAKYLLDAAQKVTMGAVDLELAAKGDLEEARQMLRQINGVGPKVAECALLFGCYRVEAVPVDVWIKRAFQYFYPEGMPQFLRPYGGIAQQVIFHYVRCCKEALPAEYRKSV